MTTLRIEKGLLPASITVPSSKSYANRALILAATKSSPVTLRSVPAATDVVHLTEALRKAGLDISQDNDSLTIHNSFPACEKSGATIETGEGGTTARFLAALLLTGKKHYTLILGNRLKQRPWDELISSATKLGAVTRIDDNKLHLQGPVNPPSELVIDCSRTTQFATAFDLVLPKTKVQPANLRSSQSYLRMNEPLKSHFQKSGEYTVPADWSSAAFPMAFAALNQTIRFPGLHHDPFQADAKLFTILKSLSAVAMDSGGITVQKFTGHAPLDFNVSDCLDLFPALAFLLSHIEGQHRLTGIDNLVHKESDRLKEMSALLEKFGRKSSGFNGEFIIEGSSLKSGPVDLVLPDDHRIVMAGALFLRHHSGGSITPAQAANKSYPEFFQLMR